MPKRRICARRYGQLWSCSEIAALKRMREACKSFNEIGAALGRSPNGCRRQASRYGVFAPEPAVRGTKAPAAGQNARKQSIACLHCRRPFKSEGPHNRLCVSCRRLSLNPFEAPVMVLR